MCSNGNYYVGHTDNLEKRLAEHQSGIFNGYTSFRLPVRLIFNGLFESRADAFAMEQKIKKWSRAKKEALVNGDYELLSSKAKKIFKSAHVSSE